MCASYEPLVANKCIQLFGERLDKYDSNEEFADNAIGTQLSPKKQRPMLYLDFSF